ncbi:MAG: SulP family inorganic anion transporter [Bdellovibrio sp.]|nr:SulP family inorganic anion transporter [Bdellovibrio sp.]
MKPAHFSLKETLAGLTTAAVVIPKAMAYASVAGLSLAVGMYTCLLPIIVYAFLGTSQVLSVTSTTTLAILTATEQTNFPASAPTLTVLVGLVLIAAAVFRLGFLSNFISSSVLIGFKCGIGLVIILDQAAKLFGLHIAKQNFFFDLGHLIQSLPQSSLPSVILSLGAFATYYALRKWLPKFPGSLVLIAGGILLSWYFQFKDQFGIAVVGEIPLGLPTLSRPSWSLIGDLIPGALGIALMSFTESIAVARTFYRSGDKPLNPDRELLATGAGNILGGLFNAMPSGGGASQTAVYRAAGGSTQQGHLIVAAVAAATLLFLAPLLSYLPHPLLAAIVIIYSLSLIQVEEFKEVFKIRNMEFRWAVAACCGVLIFGTLKGILIAIIMSLLGLASQTTFARVSVLGRKRHTAVLRPLSDEHPQDETFPGLLILRPEGRIFFLNAQIIGTQIKTLVQKHNPHTLLVDLSRVQDIEYSALKMLMEGERAMAGRGITVWFSAMNPNVLDMVRRSGWDTYLQSRMFFNAQLAVDLYLTGHHRRDDTRGMSI